MSTSSQNDFCRPKLCCLSCTQLTNTPKNTASGDIFGLAKPLRRIRKFLTDVRSGTPIYVCCFKHGRNRCSPRPRCCTRIATKETKHILALFGGTPGAIPPPQKKKIMRVRTVVPHLCSRFHANPFRFGVVITKNPSTTPT